MKGCSKTVLHGWPEHESATVLAAMPELPLMTMGSGEATRKHWERWQEGLTIKPTLLEKPPPLRMLWVMDNPAGHKTLEFVCRLFEHRIMPLYTPVGGS